MNTELEIELLPEEVEISTKLIGPEKDKQPIKFLLKKPKLEGDGAFHEKAKRTQRLILEVHQKLKRKLMVRLIEICLKQETKKKR